MKGKLNKLGFTLELAYYYEDSDTLENFLEKVQEAIYQEEIIYYYKAMEYLTENDNSLFRSIEIVTDLGFELKNINSEILATLLYQQNLSEELSELTPSIEEIFNN